MRRGIRGLWWPPRAGERESQMGAAGCGSPTLYPPYTLTGLALHQLPYTLPGLALHQPPYTLPYTSHPTLCLDYTTHPTLCLNLPCTGHPTLYPTLATLHSALHQTPSQPKSYSPAVHSLLLTLHPAFYTTAKFNTHYE